MFNVNCQKETKEKLLGRVRGWDGKNGILFNVDNLFSVLKCS